MLLGGIIDHCSVSKPNGGIDIISLDKKINPVEVELISGFLTEAGFWLDSYKDRAHLNYGSKSRL